jgi:hypothetical protein
MTNKRYENYEVLCRKYKESVLELSDAGDAEWEYHYLNLISKQVVEKYEGILKVREKRKR